MPRITGPLVGALPVLLSLLLAACQVAGDTAAPTRPAPGQGTGGPAPITSAPPGAARPPVTSGPASPTPTAPAAPAPAGGAPGAGGQSAAAKPGGPAHPELTWSLPPVAPSMLPGWGQDDLDQLAAAIARQCAMVRPPTPWPRLCGEFRPLRGTGLKAWIETRFVAWPLAGADGQTRGLLTGYYEPLLTGSRQPDRPGQVPLYKRPTDLLRIDVNERGTSFAPQRTPLRGRLEGQQVLPYPTRAEIEEGRLLRGQELLWLDDPVEAFFLQIQGSGRVRLRDGSLARVGFADHNGHSYKAIGRSLVEMRALAPDVVNAATIKEWLREHPADAPAVMQSNPRYIFFQELTGRPAGPAGAAAAPPGPAPEAAEDAGPPGSLGISLTPGRSLATDPTRVPPGALMFVDGQRPVDGRPLQRLAMNQDTGAAITGPVRADYFWGFGPDAGHLAGETRHPVRLWVLWPRDLGSPQLNP